MQLWNDYEGKIIAEKYPLGPLVRPEGRSALFQLTGGAEAPAIIRLTEAINDEGQMLACWSRVAKVKQENLLTIKRFGETTFEGTPLTYAVMESSDANLADLLKERPLTHAETLQVAASVTAALTALHAQNLVHEHVDPDHVLAIGETVKLRTDCVRMCVVEPGITTAEDCASLLARDVHDLGILLLRALTLEKRLKPTIRLAAPFDRIIHNAVNGAWGLREISETLAPPAPAPAIAAPAAAAPAAVAPATGQPGRQAVSQAVRQADTGPLPSPVAPPPAAIAASLPAALADDQANPLLYQRRNQTGTVPVRRRGPLYAGMILAAVVVLAFFLRAANHNRVDQPRSAQASAAPASAPPVLASKNGAAPASHSLAVTRPPAQSIQPGWYVVAYTFNRLDQAATRAASLAKRNASLHPQVIAPSGHAPFLVAIGGPMTRPEAENVRKLARREGLPRDTFVQNYKGRS